MEIMEIGMKYPLKRVPTLKNSTTKNANLAVKFNNKKSLFGPLIVRRWLKTLRLQFGGIWGTITRGKQNGKFEKFFLGHTKL